MASSRGSGGNRSLSIEFERENRYRRGGVGWESDPLEKDFLEFFLGWLLQLGSLRRITELWESSTQRVVFIEFQL